MENKLIPRAHLTRVPGNIMPVAERENRIKDMTKLTRLELLDLKRREENLLSNTATTKRLPDKGARIKQLLNKVLEEIKRREDVEEAATMFSNLNIATRGVHALNEMEWSNGKVNAETLAAVEPVQDVLDSDDEADLNPLRAMANRNKQETKVLQPVPTLITANDLLEIKAMQQASDKLQDPSSNGNTVSGENKDALININAAAKLDKLKLKLSKMDNNTNNMASSSSSSASNGISELGEVNKHMQYLIEKTELSVEPQREKYKPYKTTISNVHDPAKERMREQGKKWENTAATPPLIQHDGTKMLSLMDSVNMQIDYLSRLKTIQEKHAAVRLAERAERLANRPNIRLPNKEELQNNPSFNVYRSANVIEGDLKLKEHDEIHDPAIVENLGGTINYVYTE